VPSIYIKDDFDRKLSSVRTHRQTERYKHIPRSALHTIYTAIKVIGEKTAGEISGQ